VTHQFVNSAASLALSDVAFAHALHLTHAILLACSLAVGELAPQIFARKTAPFATSPMPRSFPATLQAALCTHF
jgi:hypothetical protein